MIEEDLHLIQGFMHQAGTRAVADLIRSRSGEIEVYQVPIQPAIQSAPVIQQAYPAARMQHRSLPPWVLGAIVVLWVSALIGLVVWVVRWLASATATAVVGHSSAVVVLMGLAALAAMMLIGRRRGSRVKCAGVHCGGCDQ